DRHFSLSMSSGGDSLRPSMLRSALCGVEIMPWVRHNDQPEVGRVSLVWGLTAIVDILDLSGRERNLLQKAFSNHDYHEDDDAGRASFVALSAHLPELPSERYQRAAARLACDAANGAVRELLPSKDRVAVPVRPAWRRWADQAVIAIG